MIWKGEGLTQGNKFEGQNGRTDANEEIMREGMKEPVSETLWQKSLRLCKWLDTLNGDYPKKKEKSKMT